MNEKEKYEMPIIYAWCGKHMGVKSCNQPGAVTHGICPACLACLAAVLSEMNAKSAHSQTPRGANA
jgi:hypothetical protein